MAGPKTQDGGTRYILANQARCPAVTDRFSGASGFAYDMSPLIRRFEAKDHEAAMDLWKRTPGVGLSSSDEKQAIECFLTRNPGLSFVAEDEGMIVGTILCGHDGRRGLIHHLVTSATFRRRGLGRLLLRAGLQALRAGGIEKCHLLVFQSNEPGLAFWRSVSATERKEMALFSISTNDVDWLIA